MSVSVLILTLNEEINIGACLDSVAWADDRIVLDSYSADRTVAIATERGARVVQRRFDNWSAHQNWAVDTIDFRHRWVLYLDADERCPEDLAAEVRAITETGSDCSAYRIRRKDFLMGRWLRHAQLYPTWLVRLFRPERIRYERLVNPVAKVDGPTRELAGHILHYPFSHGIAHWIARHNDYSDLEAQEKAKAVGLGRLDWKAMTARDPNLRRHALKDLFFRMPARPLVKFGYYYLWRRGFLDGRAGLTYASLQAIYEYLIDCKYDELVRRRRGLAL
jgi:glycosyltransferase involved in cell wall biosynthesis